MRRRFAVATGRTAAALGALGLAFTLVTEPAAAFGNNRWVTRPGCGNNYVSSGGDINYAWARTQKGSNNTCSGHMFAGLKLGASTVWLQHPGDAKVTGDPTDLTGRHKGCSACSYTYS